MLPTFILLIVLALYPLGWADIRSFRVESLFNPKIGKWIGFRNCAYLLGGDIF